MGLSRWAALWTTSGSQAAKTLTTAPTLLDRWISAHDGPGVDAQAASDGIRIKVPGTYLAIANISFIGATGDTYTMQLRVNGAGTDIRSTVDGLSNATSFMSIMAAAPLSEGDVVSVYVFSDNGAGSTFTLTNGQFGVVSI